MMSEKDIIKGILMNGNTTFTFVEVCQRCHLSEEVLIDWLEHGLLGDDYCSSSFDEVQFDHQMIDRILTAYRLQNDLEVNLQGAILILELLDEMAKMQDKLAILKRVGMIED